MKNLIFLLLGLAMSGCAVKQKVLDVAAVSMTKPYLPAGKKLVEKGEVTGQFCTDSSHSGTMGLMDEATRDAQKNSKVDFILNATYYQEGSCMTVEGTGAVIR